MSWQPTTTLETARVRAAVISAIRKYMADHDILEVTTPTFHQYPVTEPAIESFVVASEKTQQDWFLRTSAEYPMKRLLAAGWPDIYEMGPVFRDGEIGHRHEPEFTMLEWYRRGFDLSDIIADCVALIRAALQAIDKDQAVTQRIASYDDWLHQATGHFSDVTPEVLQALVGADVHATFDGDRDALLGWLFDTKVASAFAPDQLSVVTHFPASQASLAKVDPTLERALRFEIYLGQNELANGFVELTDSDEQRRRFERDNQLRTRRGQTPLPIDESLLSALAKGLPDCAGVAVGIERLLMSAIPAKDITEVISFSSGNPR
ncbi:MAG: EF-P lysine aminoacylase EpmA [Pseudomonadota bacterium]